MELFAGQLVSISKLASQGRIVAADLQIASQRQGADVIGPIEGFRKHDSKRKSGFDVAVLNQPA